MVEWEHVGHEGMRRIYCSHSDTEIAEVWVILECPYCGNEQRELGLDSVGTTYKIECNECEADYEMHFDAD